jgi:V8-like Glu-specific endopeptidase
MANSSYAIRDEAGYSTAPAGEAGGESFIEVDETGGEVVGQEAEPEAAGAHTPVSHTISTPQTQDGGNGEAAGDEFGIGFGPFSISFEAGDEAGEETEFETVEGVDESSLTEAGESDEAAVEAWYAEATAEDQQEFFAFLAPLLLPLLKSVVPALATAAAQNLPRIAGSIFQRMGKRRVAVRRREAGDEGYGIDEAALEAAAYQLEQIVDYDDRVQITNTTVIPWKRVCFLEITAGNGRHFIGSGALVAPRTVITAGHCVYMQSQGGWPRSIRVTPGCNGASHPFGQANAVGVRTVEGWRTNHQRDYDYGAIILEPGFRGPQSTFGFSNLSDAALRGRKLNLAGFDGDKPRGTMWRSRRVARAIMRRTLVYNAATMGGRSGAPVWLKRANGKRMMVGIHTNGSPSGNSATRITAPVAENLRRWAIDGGLVLPAPVARTRYRRLPTAAGARTPEETALA